MNNPKFQQFAHSYDKATPIQSDVALFLANLIAGCGYFANKNQQWLDIGCGTGKLSFAILNKFSSNLPFCQLYGLDNSQNMLNIWQENCQKFNKNSQLTFYPNLANMEILPFSDHYFDVVMSSFAVHWTSPNTLLEFCRVIKQGGQLHLAIPVKGSFSMVVERFPLLPIFDFLPSEIWLAMIEQIIQQYSGKILYHFQRNFCYEYDNLALLLKDLKNMGGTLQTEKMLPTSQLRHYLQDKNAITLNYDVLLIGITL